MEGINEGLILGYGIICTVGIMIGIWCFYPGWSWLANLIGVVGVISIVLQFIHVDFFGDRGLT